MSRVLFARAHQSCAGLEKQRFQLVDESWILRRFQYLSKSELFEKNDNHNI
jgi:hypothetical protein